MGGWLNGEIGSPIAVEREQPLQTSKETNKRPTLVLSFNLDTTNASIEDRVELVDNARRVIEKFDAVGATAALMLDGLTTDFVRRFHRDILRRIKACNIDCIRQEYTGVYPGRFIDHLNDRLAFANEAYERAELPMSNIGMLPHHNPNILTHSSLSFGHLLAHEWRYQLLSYATVPGKLRPEDRDRNIICLMDGIDEQYAILLDRRAQYSLHDLIEGESHTTVARDLRKAAVRGAEKLKPFVFCRAEIGDMAAAGRMDELLRVIEDLCLMEERKELSIIGAREASILARRYIDANKNTIPSYHLQEEELGEDALSEFFARIPYQELKDSKRKLALITAAIAHPRIIDRMSRRIRAGVPTEQNDEAKLVYHLLDALYKPGVDPLDPLPNISSDHLRELRMYDIIARSTARDKRASP